MKNRNENKTIGRSTILGCIVMLLTVVLTGVLGLSSKLNGFRDAMETYWRIWMPSTIHSALTYFCLIIFFFAICLFIALFIFAIAKRKGLCILPALGLFLSMAFLPFLLILAVPQAEAGKLGRAALYTLSGLTIMNAFAILILCLGLQPLFHAGLGFLKGAREEKEAPKAEEEPAAKEEVKEEPVEAGLSEEEVRAIVEEYLAKHKDELHKEGAVVAPAKEEEPVAEEEAAEEADEEEGDEDDEEEVEEVEEVQADGTVLKIKRKKRVPFENRLRKSVFDLRHKYYDLRDYIKWYGVKNRISIPGDTFSLKRKKYAFITIVGKHIKLYAAIDPEKYADSPIPVERATAKRYEEVPCVLRVKSDLSYRRAKQIIDDVMAEAGIKRPEGDEPKETQHPEEA